MEDKISLNAKIVQENQKALERNYTWLTLEDANAICDLNSLMMSNLQIAEDFKHMRQKYIGDYKYCRKEEAIHGRIKYVEIEEHDNEK